MQSKVRGSQLIEGDVENLKFILSSPKHDPFLYDKIVKLVGKEGVERDIIDSENEIIIVTVDKLRGNEVIDLFQLLENFYVEYGSNTIKIHNIATI